MSSPLANVWMDDSDLFGAPSLCEPALMSTAICPISVFDKFDFDSDVLGPDKDALLGELTDSNDLILPDASKDTDDVLESFRSIFPDLIDDKNEMRLDNLKSLDDNLFDNNKFMLRNDPIINETPILLSEIKIEPLEEKDTITNSLIRIPVTRSPGSVVNPNFSKPGTGGRTVKAVVVCPERSKNTVINLVRTNSKGIVLQKTVAGTRPLLNGSMMKTDSTQLPIKVNIITQKEINSLGLDKTREQSQQKCDSPVLKLENCSDTKIKLEFEELRPETPQSLTDSEEEFHPFSSPSKYSMDGKSTSIFDQENFMKDCLLDEDNFSSESYKCMPPAIVTGQVQPQIPDVFKYTPNNSPTNNGLQNDVVDPFCTKLNTESVDSVSPTNHYYSKAAANVDHDYGFTCRTPKVECIFSIDNLGIQTPSASEPPSDTDEDDLNLSDFSLNNDIENFECSDMDREQQEYFENLKHQIKYAELLQKNRERENKSRVTVSCNSEGPVKERKTAARSRKRKANTAKGRTGPLMSEPKPRAASGVSKIDPLSKITTAVPTIGSVKVRLPARQNSNNYANAAALKRRKTSSGGRVFSQTERHQHNTNEQVRRIEMRQSFEELRRLVPTLSDKPRAPKVLILQEAKGFCDELFHEDLKSQAQVTALKFQQDRLRSTLSQLRRHVAATRY